MFKESYDISTIISTIVTFLLILLVVRFILFLANRKKTQNQKPDWLEGDERCEIKKGRRKGK